MTVLELLSPLKPFISFDAHKIDNWCFRLHSKITTLFLLTSSTLVTAQMYIGDPIDCVVQGIPHSVMDTYCWIHSTFTLPSRIEGTVEGEPTAAPGVGNPLYGEQTTTHSYYQWVCFTLFFQALCFYAPRRLWLSWEGKKMKSLVPSDLVYSISDGRMPVFPIPRGILKDDVMADRVKVMRDHFARYRLRGCSRSLKVYFRRFSFCELLNLANVFLQIFFTDLFLGGMFTSYGGSVWEISNMDPEDRTDPMNLIFPKVGKCTFMRYGPTGTQQTFDGLCVLPINIINEKIYIFLWYWLVILAVVTCIFMCYRGLTVCSRAVRKALLVHKSNNVVEKVVIERVSDRISVGEWFFLCQLGSNIDPYVFGKLLEEIDKLLMQEGVGNGGIQKIEKMA